MRVLLVGGGGREHALAWQLARSSVVDELVAAPGNAGIGELATCLPVDATDVPGIVDLVERKQVDLTVVGPEAPLVAGLVDELEARGHRAFGPTRDAARIEGSKAWAKELLARHGIPAPASETFTDVTAAIMHLDAFQPPYVVKADGLAAGKGVTVAATREQAVEALQAALVEGAFGPAGDRVLIEEHLSGREISALALVDGRTVVPLPLAQDFKRVFDGDAGPNTGGMGAYSPVPFLDPDTEAAIVRDVLEATVRALEAEGIRYRGVLYAGLMLTEEGPRVLEFNCRFGDPETQAILPRLTSDLGRAIVACLDGDLAGHRLAWSEDACVTVVLASGGYPGDHATGIEITGLGEASDLEDAVLFHAGTARRDGRVVTAGGRVLAVSALGKDLAAARARAYEACELVSFEGKHFRTDIAKEAAGG
ncbi:MAG: phosphoribosylamine--glycine ligase [Actinomycetota bacterium]